VKVKPTTKSKSKEVGGKMSRFSISYKAVISALTIENKELMFSDPTAQNWAGKY
jgi:hypothetical protein